MTREPFAAVFPTPSRAAAIDLSVAAANETAVDRVMAWLGLYLPSYGTSAALHAAAILLAAFLVSPAGPVEPPPPQITGGAVPTQKPTPVERRPKTGPETQYRGPLKPKPSSLARRTTLYPIQDVAANNRKTLAVLGIQGGGVDIGDLGGLGPDRIFGDPSSRCPSESERARKIVFLVDRSGSMGDAIEIVKMELKTTIEELGEDSEFHVIFYSSGQPVEMPTRRLVTATERNKQLAFEFIDGIIAQGETDPSKAIERAFAVGPDLIYLLTDGEFDRAVVGMVHRLNAGGKVTVHTIGFLYRGPGEAILKDIAAQNGGQFKFVSEEDLVALGGA
jgi:hypothetical protein